VGAASVIVSSPTTKASQNEKAHLMIDRKFSDKRMRCRERVKGKVPFDCLPLW